MRIRQLGSTDVILTIAAVLLLAWVVGRDVLAERRQVQSVGPTYIEGWEQALELGIETGRSDASVKIVEFLDLQCPACAHYHSGALARFLGSASAAEVSFTTVHFPLPTHPYAEPAALAAECASRQGAFGAFVSNALARQREFSNAPWNEIARESGATDSTKFAQCLEDPAARARVEAGKELARKLGITGTPTILVNGRKYRSPPSTDVLLAAIRDAGERE